MLDRLHSFPPVPLCRDLHISGQQTRGIWLVVHIDQLRFSLYALRIDSGGLLCVLLSCSVHTSQGVGENKEVITLKKKIALIADCCLSFLFMQTRSGCRFDCFVSIKELLFQCSFAHWLVAREHDDANLFSIRSSGCHWKCSVTIQFFLILRVFTDFGPPFQRRSS